MKESSIFDSFAGFNEKIDTYSVTHIPALTKSDGKEIIIFEYPSNSSVSFIPLYFIKIKTQLLGS